MLAYLFKVSTTWLNAGCSEKFVNSMNRRQSRFGSILPRDGGQISKGSILEWLVPLFN